jgi:hypothetical protein
VPQLCPTCLTTHEIWNPRSGRPLATVTCPACGARGLCVWLFLRLYRQCPADLWAQQRATNRREAPAAAWCFGFEDGYLSNPRHAWPWRPHAPTDRERAAYDAGKAAGEQRRFRVLEFLAHHARPTRAQLRQIAAGTPMTSPRRRTSTAAPRPPRWFRARAA